MFKLTEKELKNATFSFIKAIALSLAREIDCGAVELRADLERVLSYAQDARISA